MNTEEFKKLSQKIRDNQASEEEVSSFLKELDNTLSEVRSILISKKKN